MVNGVGYRHILIIYPNVDINLICTPIWTNTYSVVKAAINHGMKIRCVGSSLSYSNLYPDEEQVLLRTDQLRSRDSGRDIELDKTDVRIALKHKMRLIYIA